jgi:hypothetical protein
MTVQAAAVPQPGEQTADLAGDANTVLAMICGYWTTQIVRAAASLSVADHIADGAVTAVDIAAREGSDPATTQRLLRACAALGLLVHHGGQRYSLTPPGGLLRAGVPGSLRDMALVQGAPLHWQAWSLMPESVRSGATQVRQALGLEEGQTAFDYLAAHPGEGALFSRAMSNATGLIIEDVTAAADLEGVQVAVDVGGADGALVLALMRAKQTLRGIVLDLPHVVGDAEREAGKAGVADRFIAVAGDFFSAVPRADLYLLKMVLHDWDDEACAAILRSCRASAEAGSRALVIDSVVSHPVAPGSAAAFMDLNMLALGDGEERDLGQFEELFVATGWRRVSTTNTRTAHVIQELVAE